MKSTLKTMTVSLTVLTVVAGAALGLLNYFTAGPIADSAQRALHEALATILPDFDNDISGDMAEIDGCAVYPALLGDKRVGVAVESFSDAGFGGRINVLFGFDCNGCVLGYKVLRHIETPGLGANMQTWFDDEGSRHNIIGSSSSLQVKADGGEIDAMTGATISSRAFLEALNSARRAFETYISRR